MIFGLYAIYDKKSKNFLQVQTTYTDGVAIRNFAMLYEDETSMISKYPEDFDLYCVGDYDSESGLIVPKNVPDLIWTGQQLKDGEYCGY